LPTGIVNSAMPETKRKAFALLLESLLALRRENKEVLWSSMIKDTMKRKKPSFNEAYHGYRTFSELLEDAQAQGLVELDTDKRSRTYVVTRFGAELTAKKEAPETPEAKKKKSRRRRGGKKTQASVSAPHPEQKSPPPDEPAVAAAVDTASSVEVSGEPGDGPAEPRDLFAPAPEPEPEPRLEAPADPDPSV
jgi:predicted transcriptional regulator